METTGRVLFIGSGSRTQAHVRALQASGHECDLVPAIDQAMDRLREPGMVFDLVVWDTEDQQRAFDEAFDKGRYQTAVPTLLLLDRVYPWVAAQGHRPGSLDYLVKPVAPHDLAAAADRNVRVVRARRALDQARARMAEAMDLLGEAGKLLAPTGFGTEAGAGAGRPPLSEREEEIARALAHGHRVPQIARIMAISPHTVRNHFKSIFRKTGVHSQIELLARLRERFAGD